MKKIISIIVSILLVAIVLSGCSKNDAAVSQTVTDRFYYMQDTNSGLGYNMIIVDKETGVMYLFHGAGYRGGLTTMVGADGNPLIYDGTY